jgi:hypothetical protein
MEKRAQSHLRRAASLAFVLALPLAAHAADATLSITGLVSHPLQLSMADLRALPQVHVIPQMQNANGVVTLDCTGAALLDILDRASPSFGAAKNAKLAHTLLFTANDGYAVALSFGEIDADYGGAAPVIATDCAGKPLAAPRLVVPSDVHAGRAIHGVVTIEIK